MLVGVWLSGCVSTPMGLITPNGVAVAADGSLYVMDKGNKRVVHLGTDGKFLGSFGAFGKEVDQIYHGWDMALDAEGNIYFCNFVQDDEKIHHDGVKVFSAEGAFLREIGAQDYDNDPHTTPNKPYGLDIDNSGRLFVADYIANTVRVFDAQGNLLGRLFGDNGAEKFAGINDVAIDDTRQLLYVVDNDAQKIEQFRLSFSQQGAPQVEHLLTIGQYGRGQGELAFPQNLAVDDTSGLLYVGDMANRRIQVFDPQGNYVNSFVPDGVSDWQVMGLNFGLDGNLYAADAFNGLIWVFSPDGTLKQRFEVDQ